MHLLGSDRLPPFTTSLTLALIIGSPVLARAADPGAAVAERMRADPPALAIVAVEAPPSAPAAALVDLVHQLRTACRERSTGVLSARELRERLGAVGHTPVPELERAYAAAQAAFQADELDTALRLLRGVVAELERSPESRAGYELWLRAQVRIALAERSAGNRAAMVAALDRVLALELAYRLDDDQYGPSFRRDFEELRRLAALAPRHELVVQAPPGGLVAYVDGKDVGPVPARIRLPAGRYRVTAAEQDAGEESARTPAVVVALGDSDREVVLDTALAEAVRVQAGPGLSVDRAHEPAALVAFGRWVGADRVVAAELVRDGDRPLLVASLRDVATGARVRDVRARVVEGTVAPTVLGIAAAYLLGGDAPVVPGAIARRGTTLALDGEVARDAPSPRWLEPAAYVAGALAAGLGLVAVLQARASADAYRDASAMVRGDGALLPGTDRARYDGTIAAADGARRTAVIGAAGAAALAVTAGVLGYWSLDARGAPVAGFRF